MNTQKYQEARESREMTLMEEPDRRDRPCADEALSAKKFIGVHSLFAGSCLICP